MTLDKIADSAGRSAILAMDQRGTLRTMLERSGRPATRTWAPSTFLRTTAVDRMRRLNAATAGRGRSWREVAV
jgi:tagatose-1,6-bisphosphate aldolase